MVTRVYPASHPMTVGIGARATMRWKSWEKWIDRWTCGYQPLWLVAFSNGAMATVTDRHTFWPQCGFELRAFEVKNEVLFLTLRYLDEKNWKPHPSSSVYPILWVRDVGAYSRWHGVRGRVYPGQIASLSGLTERERQPFICELSLRERARTSVIQEWLKVNPLGIKWVSWGGVTGVSGMCNPEVARRIVAFNWLGNTLVFLQKCWRQVGRAGHFYLDCCPLL